MPFVIITKAVQASGEERTSTKDVSGQTCTIGQAVHADLVLQDPAVGAEQAVIQEINGVYILRDVGDRGPTYVNDRPVKEVLLTKKGTIRIGKINLRFSRPTPVSPLTIEYRPAPVAERASVADGDATLVLKTSPVTGKAADPDATQALPPMAFPPQQDPDKTMVLPSRPASKAAAPADPDATQKIDSVTAPQADDPDKTMVLPKLKAPPS